LLPEAIKAMKAMRPVSDPKLRHLFSVSGGLNPAVPHTLAAAMREVSKEMIKAGEINRPITPGAIRRTVETRLAAKGFSDEVLARLLSHGLGGVQSRNYNAHHYDDEKRAALLKLRTLFEVRPSKVIKFPDKGRRAGSGTGR
jgi:integrase